MASRKNKQRRLFLKQMGLGAGAIVFNPLLIDLFNKAHAQAGGEQKLILLYMNAFPQLSQGAGDFLPMGNNFSVAAGKGPKGLSSQPLTKMSPNDWPTKLDALKPFFNNSLIVDGVYHGCNDAPGQTMHGMRYAGLNGICGNVLRGEQVQDELSIPHGPTIDQIIAGGPSGKNVSHPSVLLGMRQANYSWQKKDIELTQACFASAANSPLPYFSRVKALERSLFGQDYVDGKTGDDGSKQLKTNRRKSVLDVLRADVNRLEKRTPAEFKDKVYGVLESFESFDNKKQAQEQNQCTLPGPTGIDKGDNAEDELLALADASTLAMKCGMTRVIGMGMGVEMSHSSDIGYKKNVDQKVRDRWSDASVSSSGSSNFYSSSWHYHNSGEQWNNNNGRIVDFYAQILARMLENLSGQKGVMPDNTTVMLVTDRGMSAGNHHGSRRSPIFIWSTNPAFQTGGQYIRYETKDWYGRMTDFTALSDFYRTIATGFGVNMPSFGIYGGPLLNDILK
jgi:hypothetical protein